MKLLNSKMPIILLVGLFIGLCVFTLLQGPTSLNNKVKKPTVGGIAVQSAKKVENVKNIPAVGFVVLNKKTLKYHKPDCKYGLKTKNFEIIREEDLPKGALPCKFCHSTSKKYPPKLSEEKIISLPVPPLSYKSSNIKVFLTDLTTTLKPDSTCSTAFCQELLKQINTANTSIDFAIYGYTKIPAIQIALENSISRGVEVRLVFDVDSKGANIYPDTMYLSQVIKKHGADYVEGAAAGGGSPAIMHNKFFIFDRQIVMTGSANLSNTDMSGFNTNSVIMVNSKGLADFYTREFEQMYIDKKFHKEKTVHNFVADNVVEAYFSPQDRVVTQKIIPLVKSAKTYIYMPVFLITHRGLTDALIEARARGVRVRVIVDATNTGHQSSSVALLRAAGVEVKVENYAGKVHSKSMIIDDLYVVIGSMNFSKSGESVNDENVVVVKDRDVAIFYKNFFNYLWAKIPDKYLKQNVRSESFDSIGSCSDGIDNNFDGKIDAQDIGCIKSKVQ